MKYADGPERHKRYEGQNERWEEGEGKSGTGEGKTTDAEDAGGVTGERSYKQDVKKCKYKSMIMF